ncbi:MAG: gluconokinase, partial [Candidatus Latescibacteria bacterium]|nr:gluconokinase [Candidatus Latescibacterota bacterium]
MVIIIMGVTGSGKSTVGEQLAQDLDWPYYDADDFHPEDNVQKMASGTPLTDEDRWPWLEALAVEIGCWLASDKGAILG